MADHATRIRSTMTPPEPAPAQAGAGVLHDALNERPAVQRQFALAAALNHTVVQPKWIEGKGAVLQWDKLMNGLQWFYDQESQKMWFERVKEGPQREDEEKLRGERLTYAEWLSLGWGTKSEEYKKMVEVGKTRWNRLQKTLTEETAGRIPEESQKARDEFFATKYQTTTAGDEDSMNLNSILKEGGKVPIVAERGVYRNNAELLAGRLNANHNYAKEAGEEEYFDPVAKKNEKISNSEILYQHWKRAATLSKQKTPPLKTLKRGHISGEQGLPMAKALAMAVFGENFVPEDRTFMPGDDAFYALLALPNVVSALWLISDHGRELGISGIESITLMKGFSALITFESPKE